MEDLLKEDEFITVKYNPWKRFGIFYIITFVVFTGYYFVHELITGEPPEHFQTLFIMFGLPFCMSFVMIFHKKENIGLPLKTTALALFMLIMTSFVGLAVIGLVENISDFIESIQFFFMFGGVYLVLFILISAIILPIVRFKQKKRAKLRRKF